MNVHAAIVWIAPREASELKFVLLKPVTVIVPGVSGSAVAVIFGLYEKLLYAFGNFFRRREPRQTGCVYLPYAFLIPPRASRIFSHSGLKMLVFSTRTGMSFLISSEFASMTDLAFL